MLNRSDEGALIARAQAGDRAAMNEAIRANIGLVKTIAKRYCFAGDEADDYVSAGLEAVWRGIQAYDPHRGAKLSSYAGRKIRAAMQDVGEDRGIVWVPSDVQQKMRGWNPRDYHGRTLADGIAASGGSVPIHSDKYKHGDGYRTDLPPAEAPDVEWHDLAMKRWFAVMGAKATLDAREQDVLWRRYSSDPSETLAEVADRYGLTRERVRQIEARALRKIRAAIRQNEAHAIDLWG
jgi:RNA polymerase sigma factor (sigma-70 family)